MSEKYLIINADDFGMCNAQNQAIMDLFKRGCISSSTIMAPCPWAPYAVEFAKNNPQFAIGIHLTTTSEWGKYRWSPVNTEHCSTLIDDEGFMWHESDQFEKNASEEDVEHEILAQINKLKKLGLEPSHLDNHMGSLYGIETGRFDFLMIVFKIAGSLGLPFRIPTVFSDEQYENKMLDIKIPKAMIEMVFAQLAQAGRDAGVPMLDYLIPGDWNGPQDESYDSFKEYLYALFDKLPDGITETYIHPALECDELKAITANWHRRVWEYELYKDSQTIQHIKSLGIKIIDYRDLKRMRTG